MSAVDGPLEAWRALGSPAWPPAPGREASPGPCWLCGMPTATSGDAWRLKDFLTPTFTNHTLAAVPWSEAVCQACVYLGSGDAWRAHCLAHPEEDMAPDVARSPRALRGEVVAMVEKRPWVVAESARMREFTELCVRAWRRHLAEQAGKEQQDGR